VKNNWLALQFAADNLKNNFAIALEAVKNNWLALQFASKEIRNNKLVCITAIWNNISTYDLCWENLITDEDILEKVFSYLRQDLWAGLDKLPRNIKNIFISVLSYDQNAFKSTQYSFIKENESILNGILKKNIDMFPYIPEKFKSDEKFIITCMKNIWYTKILKYLSEETKSLPKIKNIITKKNDDLIAIWYLKDGIKIGRIFDKKQKEYIIWVALFAILLHEKPEIFDHDMISFTTNCRIFCRICVNRRVWERKTIIQLRRANNLTKMAINE
jgi:hypothetical protein